LNTALAVFLLALTCLAWAFYRLEKSGLSSKEIPLIALLAAIAALGRIPFAALPGVQPTTFVVVISGFVFGGGVGFMIGAVAGLVANCFLGHGPWTVWQMLMWGACGGSAGLFGRIFPRAGRLGLVAFAFAWGFLFGWGVNFWYWYSFVQPLSLSTWLAVSAVSFPLDAVHAAGNAVFMALLGNGCITTLRYFKKRLELSYLSC